VQFSIVLIGFMGVGKTTVGHILAENITAKFVDLDSQIEQSAGCSIAQIFALEGEEKFRHLETEALSKVDGTVPSVISTGGGIISLPENWRLMHRIGRVVYLQAKWPTLVERLVDTSNRPLATGVGMKNSQEINDKLHKLWLSRLPLYRQADVIVNTDNLTPAQVVEQIILALED
jgi:shikimate kinase